LKQVGVNVLFLFQVIQLGAHFDSNEHQQLDHALVSLAMPATTLDLLKEAGVGTRRHLYAFFMLSQIKHCWNEIKLPQRILTDPK